MKVKEKTILERDILEWNIPEEVVAVLLKDRSTGLNLIWATEDYVARGEGFASTTGTYCKIMDWNAGQPIEFRSTAENGGGHG
jgi:hypothetical protein